MSKPSREKCVGTKNTALRGPIATIQSLFEALDNVRRLWNVCATGPAPEDKQLATWMQHFSEAELMHAFQRVGVRFRHGYTEADLLYRYATGNLVKERKMKVSPQTAPTVGGGHQ